ncbi:MAG: hypothetical protein ACLP9L_08375, partial [Thermoguttaceae bacterium]
MTAANHYRARPQDCRCALPKFAYSFKNLENLFQKQVQATVSSACDWVLETSSENLFQEQVRVAVF